MNLLEWAREVQAVAQSGLTYATGHYDLERYGQLQELTAKLIASEANVPLAQAAALWAHDSGYATPKIDVRGAVFKEDQILMVRESDEGLWSLPGGWADVNDSPSEAVVREVFEESGYRVIARKLAALWDRNLHPHPPIFHHLYKLFFVCELVGGEAATSYETDEVGFFPLDNLPPLSLYRVTGQQIARMFEHMRNAALPTDFD